MYLLVYEGIVDRSILIERIENIYILDDGINVERAVRLHLGLWDLHAYSQLLIT